MTSPPRTGYAVECFWPDVREKDLRGLDRRIGVALSALAHGGEPVRYLGWLLVIDDEVVLVMFEGPIGTVRRVAEQAEIPFGRILRVTRAPSPPVPSTGEETPE